MPRLDLRICGARGLPNSQTFGKIDPYCTVSLEGKQWKTNTAENTTEPEWNEVFKFHVADDDSSRLHFVIWDDNVVSDDFLGEYYMSISGLDRGVVDDKWVLLQNCKGNAELHVRLMAVDFGDVPEEEREQVTAPVPVARPMPQNYQPPAEQAQYYQAPPPEQRQQYFQQAPNRIESWFGRPIFLRNEFHGNYLRSHPGGAEAPVDIQQQDKLGGWEIHYLVPSEFGGVAIKTSHGEEWVRGLGGANVPCNVSTCLNTWETWEFIQVGPNVYNIRNKFHGAYLRGHPGGEGAKVDNSSMADTWERWSIQPAQ